MCLMHEGRRKPTFIEGVTFEGVFALEGVCVQALRAATVKHGHPGLNQWILLKHTKHSARVCSAPLTAGKYYHCNEYEEGMVQLHRPPGRVFISCAGRHRKSEPIDSGPVCGVITLTITRVKALWRTWVWCCVVFTLTFRWEAKRKFI